MNDRVDNSPLLVSVENVCKKYGERMVVKNVSLHMKKGEIVGLLGPNGAGKTTTFYMVVGLVRPDAGKIKFNDMDITGLPVHKRARLGMGYLAQEPSVFRKLTVEENVMAILETQNLKKKARNERLFELLSDLGLEKVAKQKAYTLSGGERRKLEITRALVSNPAMIMLDEPFSGVDPLSVNDIQDIIRNLSKRGLGILITDHNVRETLSVVTRAYLLYDGKVLCEGERDFLTNDEAAKRLYLGDNFKM